MIKSLKKYRLFILLLVIDLSFCFFRPQLGFSALSVSWSNLVEMLKVLPPIFILLGLLDVWVKKETMVRLMGENSGWLGILMAFVLGSAAAGPLYGAFPVAVVLLKKGCKLSNVFILIGAWSTTKLPLLLFEATALGWKFMLIRLVIDLFGIVIIAYLLTLFLTPLDQQEIYQRALNQD